MGATVLTDEEKAQKKAKAEEKKALADKAKAKAEAKIKTPVEEFDDGEVAQDYLLGTINDAPNQDFTIGGVSFPHHTFQHEKDSDGVYQSSNRIMGHVLSLFKEDVARIKIAIEKKVIRWNIGQKKASILSKGPGYRKQKGDEPIGKYIYFVAVEDVKENADWSKTCPPTYSELLKKG